MAGVSRDEMRWPGWRWDGWDGWDADNIETTDRPTTQQYRRVPTGLTAHRESDMFQTPPPI